MSSVSSGFGRDRPSSALTRTLHATTRIAQRGLSSDLDLIVLVGTEVSDGYFVREKDCEALEQQLRQLISRIRRLRGKFVVVANSKVVTAYHAGKRKERHLLRHSEERNMTN